MRLFSSLLRNKSGATAVEYGLLVAILALALFAALGDYYEIMNEMFGGLADTYANATD
ncbi:Flp family type IVb pilin [Neorhizobium sp. CSC1952]|uniref:Flp family type IVb pilin n=1 Tax=Rhizobium/Agrobacterium group TaxID=227290 RepID=UPI000A19964E|nr:MULTISPECIES: Flp family type IVb pilin [Rhizobium/Agrobacterium group]WJR69367.1 Flp family type IVb pilin [Rhizobium sp. CSC1952]